ncbi:Smr/MutS family protein [Methylocapsa acidiphila]|uniref:Smr/MutS family protein n=1 Tax=Methylocapsa acidiphila TaxID=133552 RepID=UPI00040FD70F|nr:Smr/MutS family protein [Methylocapsa acidiphila]
MSSFGRARARRLTAEEIELWLTVAKTVEPRRGHLLPKPAPVEGMAAPSVDPAPAVAAEIAPAAPAATPRSQKPPPLAPLERRLRQKLSRGLAAPDAAIDLHGMRRQEAFVALRQFLSRAQRDGARLVLVVTGKGERGGAEDGDSGVLRRNVPQWLRGPEYHAIVIGFEEAARPHGGAGALYVRLRRRDRAPRGNP